MIAGKPFDLPPYPYLSQVLEHCPKAGSTYLLLWRSMDKNGLVNISKEHIRTSYLLSVAKFRHDILLLVKEGLVSVDESPNMMTIEVIQWDDSDWDEE